MTSAPAASFVVGADLGGTNVRAAVIEIASGKIVARSQNVPSRGMDGPEYTADQIAAAVNEAIGLSQISRDQIRGVGLAVPGHVRPADGTVLWAPNFYQQWRGVPLGPLVGGRVSLPVYLGNDANLAALGRVYLWHRPRHAAPGGSDARDGRRERSYYRWAHAARA